MNIATPAIIIILLLIPGIIARNTFLKEGWNRAVHEGNTLEAIVQSSIVAIPIHWILLSGAYFGLNIKVDTRSFVIVLCNAWGNDTGDLGMVVESLNSSTNLILIYFFISILFAYICGLLCFLVIRKTGLDLYVQPLRYSNYLIYNFRGNIILFPNNNVQKLQIELFLKKEFLNYHLKQLFNDLDTSFIDDITHNEWKTTNHNFIKRFLRFKTDSQIDVVWLVTRIMKTTKFGKSEIIEKIEKYLLPSISSFNINQEIQKIITRVDVDIEIDNRTYLYQGYVHDVYFDNNGELDKIELIYASKRKYTEDENNSDNEMNAIPGNIFFIKAEHIKTINFTYFPVKVFEYRLGLI